jgi:alpha-glucoside transport system substrate-binding protein
MLDDPPGCWLSQMPSFFPDLVREGAVAGVDYDFFVLPSLEPGGPAPVFGGATLLGALSDRPEVRAFLRQTMNPNAVPAVAASTANVFIPAHAAFVSGGCAAPDQPAETDDLRERLCEATRASVADGLFRLDASDAMPPEIGGLASVRADRGAFLLGMADFVNEGPGNLDEVLRRIDEAWPS